jgi:uncharacterized membrane protein YccC
MMHTKLTIRPQHVNWSRWIRRGLMVLTIYVVGLLEGYYLPPYGIEWMLGVMGGTAFLAGYWIRTGWDYQ